MLTKKQLVEYSITTVIIIGCFVAILFLAAGNTKLRKENKSLLYHNILLMEQKERYYLIEPFIPELLDCYMEHCVSDTSYLVPENGR